MYTLGVKELVQNLPGVTAAGAIIAILVLICAFCIYHVKQWYFLY